MEINISEDKEAGLVIEFAGVDRSIPELIKERVLKDSNIDFATVVKEHPLVGNPKLIVKGGKGARKAVEHAIDEVEEEVRTLSAKLKKK